MSQIYQYQGEVTNVNTQMGGKQVPAEANGRSSAPILPTFQISGTSSGVKTNTIAKIDGDRLILTHDEYGSRRGHSIGTEDITAIDLKTGRTLSHQHAEKHR